MKGLFKQRIQNSEIQTLAEPDGGSLEGAQSGYDHPALPSTQELANDNELGWGQALGEDVGPLLQGADILGLDPFLLADVRPEEVVLEGQVLVAWGHLGDIDQGQAALVVLEDGGPD